MPDYSRYLVVAREVVKSFGKKQVLHGISLTLEPGEALYILGPNGSGKTTLVRTILGLYQVNGGVVSVLGVSPGSNEWDRVKRFIGYLPENADIYERLTGLEIIEFYAKLYGVSNWKNLVERAIEVSGLDIEDLTRRAGEYSKGMRRRILLSIALMHRPKLLVLDEPFSGVDVISAHRMKSILAREAREQGTGVIATSHNVLEAEKYASKILFIYKGRRVFYGSPSDALRVFGVENLEEAFVRAVQNEN